MTFVFPVLLGGLLLAAIPVLLHLIMRQKPKTLLFPAFRFLLQRHRTNQRKLRLRHLLLLALRIILIAAICLALARPKLFDIGFALQTDRPVAAIFLFDTSPSTEYKTSDGATRLADAQKRGLELLDELPEGSRIAILDTADLATSGPGEWLRTRHQARERIQNLRISPANGPVTQRLEGAYRLFADLARNREDAAAAQMPRLLCLFSDRTRGAWDAGRLATLYDLSDQVPPLLEGLTQARGNLPSLKELLRDLRQKLPPAAGVDYPEQALLDDIDKLLEQIPGLSPEDFPPAPALGSLVASVRSRARDVLARLPADEQTAGDVKEYRGKLVSGLQRALRDLGGVHALFLDVGIDQPVDLAITQIEFPRTLSGQVRQVFGANERITLRVHVQATGKDFTNILQSRIGRETYKQEVVLKAGEKKSLPLDVDAAFLKLNPGPHPVEIGWATVSTDSLAFNNTAYATFAIREPRRVLIIADDKSQAATLQRIFKAAEAVLGYEADVQTEPVKSLQGYKAVFLSSLAKPSDRLWGLLEDYVRQGGGLAIIPGDAKMDLAAYNKDPAQKLMPGILKTTVSQGSAAEQKNGALWNLAQDSILQHPMLQRFREWRHDQNIDFIAHPQEAYYYWDVQPHPQGGVALVNYKDEKDRPAVLERQVEQGRVLLFTTLFDYDRQPVWNNYNSKSFLAVLTIFATNYLAGNPDEQSLNFQSGQADPVVLLPPGQRFPTYNLRGPELFDPIAVADRQTELRLKQALSPGNYTVEGVDGTRGSIRVASFSVNPPPEESNLTRVPPSEIQSLLGPDALLPLDRRASIREALEGHWSQPLELFPYLMLLLVFVLALENLLANKFYKREAEANEGSTG